MKKKIKVLAVVTAMIISLQTGLIASAENQTDSNSTQLAMDGTVQPYGLYLMMGQCFISPNNGYVTAWGSTQAYSSVSEISCTLTVYREISTGVWSYVWSSTVTDYNSDYCDFPKKNVSVSPGRYKIEGTHTVKHAGRTETNTSVSGTITVQ